MLDMRFAHQFLRAAEGIDHGSLTILTPEGVRHRFEGARPGPDASLDLRDWRAVTAMAAKGDIGLAEAYRDHWCETPDLVSLLQLGLLNEHALDRFIYGHRLRGLAIRALYLVNRNSRAGARRNIAAHYDLGNDFYRLWLDPGMTYSSALFGPGDDLARAQQRKYDRIITNLASHSGSLLEIGCGWGGFLDRARDCGDFRATGLTLSRPQADLARTRLDGWAEIALRDYRDETRRFDHVVSIEMFEAVGERFWPVFFQRLARCLKQGGRAMVQTIIIADRYFARYRKGGDMIRSFVFPGGMLPGPARFEAGVQRAGLVVEDAFAFGADYARTLRIWLARFDAGRDEVRALGFDDAFIRIWRFYLAACAASFEVGRTDVVQYRLAHG